MEDMDLPVLPQVVNLIESNGEEVADKSTFDLGPQWNFSDDSEGGHDNTLVNINFLPGHEYGFFSWVSFESHWSLFVRNSSCQSSVFFSDSGALTSTQCSGGIPVIFTGLLDGSKDVHCEVPIEKSELMSTMNAEDVCNKSFHETWDRIPSSQPVVDSPDFWQ